MMRALPTAVVCAILWAAAPARAQSAVDFSGLRAAVGDQVYVMDPATGVEVGGRITALTPSRLSIDGYSFAPIEGLKIERPGDPIWDGAHRLRRGRPCRRPRMRRWSSVGMHEERGDGVRSARRDHRPRARRTSHNLSRSGAADDDAGRSGYQA
jgi:hypothetical protein